MNALGIPGVINNFNLYNDGTVLVGLTGEISLPDFEGMTETLSGPGILGEIEEVIIGQFLRTAGCKSRSAGITSRLFC